MLTKNSLDFAKRHIQSFYDTDFYPKPFEYRAIWYFWDDVKEYLLETPLATLFSSPPKMVAWPKARGGYRVVHQLEPLDAITYVALVHSVAQKLSDARMGPEIACSYRIDLDAFSFFSEGSGFSTYRKRCEELSDRYEYVLTTDISDFYNQIYLHRVGNAIESAASHEAGKQIETFISRLNNKASQGIPVGPSPSVILAEAVMIDVDQYILNAGFEHVRYVDDIRIFSDSKRELEIFLESLVIYLHEAHRLNVVSEKTNVKKSSEFLHSELQNQYQLEKLDILRDIEVANPYSMHVTAEEDDEDDEEAEEDDEEKDERSPGEILADALKRARNFGIVDLAVIRAIIRRAKAHALPDLALPLIEDINFFSPAANDLVLYLAALPDYELETLKPLLSQMCIEGQLEKQCIRTWMEWLFSQKPCLMQDPTITKFLFSRCSVPAQALAAVRNKNQAWAKSAKGKVLTTASWDRRAYLYSLSVLSGDERRNVITPLLKHFSLTPLDKWVARWVEAGCPEITQDDLDWEDDLPF